MKESVQETEAAPMRASLDHLEAIYVMEGPAPIYTTSSNAYQQPYQLLRHAPNSIVLSLGEPSEVMAQVRDIEGIYFAGKRSSSRWYRLHKGYDRLKGFLKSGKGNIIVSNQQPESLALGWAASRFSGLPWVVLFWDHPFGARYELSAVRRYVERPLRVAAYNAMLQTADGVVTLIHPGVLEHAGLHVSNVRTLKNGVDIERIRSLRNLRKRNKNLIGALGRVSADKGAFHIFEAFSLVRRRVPDARLLYVGEIDQSQRSEITEYLRRLHLSKSVEITGRLSPDEALRRIAKCGVGLHAYRPRPDLYWNQVLKIGEYQGLGVVPVAMDYPGASDLIEDGKNGFLVDHERPEAMAEKLVHLILNSKVRQEMASQGIQTAEKRSWNNIGKKVCKFISHIAS